MKKGSLQVFRSLNTFLFIPRIYFRYLFSNIGQETCKNEVSKYFFSFLRIYRVNRKEIYHFMSKSMKCLNNKLMIFFTDKLSTTISLSTTQLLKRKFILYEWLMTNMCHNKCIALHQLDGNSVISKLLLFWITSCI